MLNATSQNDCPTYLTRKILPASAPLSTATSSYSSRQQDYNSRQTQSDEESEPTEEKHSNDSVASQPSKPMKEDGNQTRYKRNRIPTATADENEFVVDD